MIRSRSYPAAEKVLLILMLLTFAVSCVITGASLRVILDSDASGDLVYAHHLQETGQFLSHDWYYATGLKVLSTQLVFAPLFALTDSWHTVHAVGAVILQAVLLAGFLYLCGAAGIRRAAAYLGGAVLLLPTSVAYGRIVLYHSYYIINTACSFFLTGLFLKLLWSTDAGRQGRKILRLTVFLALSFLCGMNNMRQAGITHAPLLLAVCAVLLPVLGAKKRLKARDFHPFALLILSAIVFLAGYAVNIYLSRFYQFRDYTVSRVTWNTDRLPELVFGILHYFGLRRSVPMMSAYGIVSVMGVFAGAAAIVMGCMGVRDCVAAGREGSECGEGSPLRIIRTMFPAGLITILLEVILIDKVSHPTLYVLSFVVWAVPLIADALFRESGGRILKLAAALTALVMVISGALNMMYFVDPQAHPQPHEGLANQDNALVPKLEPLIALLEEEGGYDMGYATFRYGNIVTEMTDGAMPMINITVAKDGSVSYYDWMTVGSYREKAPQKAFIILQSTSVKAFEKGEVYGRCEKLYEAPDGSFTAYRLLEPGYLYETLAASPE